MTNSIINKISNLPACPGVYTFYDRSNTIIYIGKATVLKNRVKSYFIGSHDNKTEKMIPEISDIKWQITPSTIEALILESNLIKKHQPKYNILLKDDKSYIQIAITDEEFPRILAIRPTDKTKNEIKIKKYFGPYTSSGSVNEILHIFRKIFTYRDCNEIKYLRHKKKSSPCFFQSIHLCPAPCAGLIDKNNYSEIIRQITFFLEGNGKRVISLMKKQMNSYSETLQYEKAAQVRNRIYAFQHINDIALIKKDRPLEQYFNIPVRIEAYDISNIGKHFAVGSMVVFSHGEIDKDEYRKYKINYKWTNHTNFTNEIRKQDDPGMIEQILTRRLFHKEWQMPDLIIIDGGKGQLSAALKSLRNHKLKIPVIAVAKGPKRNGFKLFKNELANNITLDKRFTEHIRDEAHRFAITYHKTLRTKNLLYTINK